MTKNPEIAELETLVNKATAKFESVSSKKMFGCHAVWVKDNVFALVWKHGRIGVKLPNEQSYQSLMSIKGSEPWKAGPMKMAHWVLLPEKYHGESGQLKKWIKIAYEQCSVLKKEKNSGLWGRKYVHKTGMIPAD